MSPASQIEILPDPARLYERVAAWIAGRVEERIALRDPVSLVLTGGSTAEGVYPILRERWKGRGAALRRLHLFWGDERVVPADHPDSNLGLARRTLLEGLELTDAQIHPFPVGILPAEAAAEGYADEIRAFFKPQAGATPVFDLVLLGVGSDGHVASLFPGDPLLDETKRWTGTVAYSNQRNPPHARLTMTFPLLIAADRIVVVTAGKSKRTAIEPLLSKTQPTGRPVERLEPGSRRIIFFADEAAAGRVG